MRSIFLRSFCVSLVMSSLVFLGMFASARGSGFSGSGGSGGGVGAVVGAEIHHTATLTLSSGVGQTIGSYASTTRNAGCTIDLSAGSITAPVTGTYTASVMTHWQDDADTVLQNGTYFWVNGAGTPPTGQAIPNTCTNHGESTRATQTLSLVAGDVVTIRVLAYTNGGGTHSLDTTDFSLDLFASGAAVIGGNVTAPITFISGLGTSPTNGAINGPLDGPLILRSPYASSGCRIIGFGKPLSQGVAKNLFKIAQTAGSQATAEIRFHATCNGTDGRTTANEWSSRQGGQRFVFSTALTTGDTINSASPVGTDATANTAGALNVIWTVTSSGGFYVLSVTATSAMATPSALSVVLDIDFEGTNTSITLL